jgi:hypothetical protein
MSNVKWLNNLKLRASYELNSKMELVVMTLKTYFQLHPYGGGIGTVLTGSTVW